MSEQESCGNCRFMDWMSDSEGQCLRYPPSILRPNRPGIASADDYTFPIIYEHEWCGEWKPAPTTTKES